ncbi:excalibur calcium-binding domain-containing protein [Isoptericola sp. 178]|uniref:excalibur calcium-binding domain-containing protein n=2 Tax=unclassified Isoptericola TaxID=2623355 RepID=UPI002712A99B|nr:excalibur calcium-binding domain-containing protein [Isoptericola sp. 178]MDO8143653.1 excalibur calcium-binding domain-containing protein [Isoptericola sp. 178]
MPSAPPQGAGDPGATTVMAPVRPDAGPPPAPSATRASAHGSARPVHDPHPTARATTPVPPQQPAAAPPNAPGHDTNRGEARAGRRQRPATVLVAGVAVACLALGVIVGVMFSMVQTGDARQAIADAERQVEQAAALEAEVTEDKAALSERAAELEARERSLKERESEIAEKESQLVSRQAELDDQAAQQQQLQQQQQQGNDKRDDDGGGQWWYWNCDAARQDGAAPIYQGSPGYRSGLDPNGNGIACEEGE